MGAHSTPGATAPTGARIATTTLALAVTSVLGTGTALAHDDSGHHGGSHTSTGEHGSSHAREKAAQARAEADESLRDVLADVDMSSWDTGDGYSSDDDEGSDPWGSEDTAPYDADDGAATQQASAPAPARPATSTQPIAAPSGGAPTELPPPGQTQSIPIR